jgi:alkaline phosphatase D
MTTILGRRRFSLLAGTSLVTAPALVRAQTKFANDPFSLGVASGYPTPTGVVLWTRLAPDPLNGGGMGDAPADVAWELASDDKFAKIVQRGSARAEADVAHSVHVEVADLRPERTYWYRFHAGSATSPSGRTRTAPAADAAPHAVRFAFASCQHYEQGYYAAYRHMARDKLDFVVHLGDYIYELSWGQKHVRKHNTPTASTLDEYRNRYALYKSDKDLQAAHAAFPWFAVWDDHEVENDYTNDRSPASWDQPSFLRRRAGAYKAWYEHMPVPKSMAPTGPNARIYGNWRFGNLAELFLVDTRQFRSHHPCANGRGGAALLTDCAERRDPALTYLGSEQEAWLSAGLAGTKARWSVLGQQTLMSQIDRGKDGISAFWMDRWDGAPASRQRVVEAMAANYNASPVVIGGDVHSYWVADLMSDYAKDKAPIVASEFVGGSISSIGPSKENVRTLLDRNPHLRYGRGDKRGYATMELTSKACRVNFEAIDNVYEPYSASTRIAKFAVEHGKPGAQKG